MRILVVANFQIEYSIQLANAMARLCEVSLVLWDQMAPDLRGQVEENVKVIEFRGPGIISWSRAYTQARVAQFASQSNADIVHFQNAYAWNSLYPRSYRLCAVTRTTPSPPRLANDSLATSVSTPVPLSCGTVSRPCHSADRKSLDSVPASCLESPRHSPWRFFIFIRVC